ncbi:GGDEF domain-containing protein [Chitinimonas naiadis]
MTDPLVLLSITGLFSLLNLLTLGSLIRRDESVRYFLVANGVLLLAIVGYCLRQAAPAFVSIVVANTLYFVANLLLVLGCRRYFGLPLYAGWWLLPWGLASTLLSYYYYGEENYPFRVLIGSVFCALTCSCVGWTVLRHIPAGRPRYSYVFTGSLALLCAMLHLLRGGLHVLMLSSNRDVAEATVSSMVFLVIGTLLTPAISVGMIMMVHDRIAAALEGIANHDFLTGVLSRRAWMQALDGELRAGSPLTVAILDIDFFKRINDRYGHAAGDAVLCQFASQAKAVLRHGDSLGRLGGEEFAILLRHADRDAAQCVLQRLRAQLQTHPCLYEAQVIVCTFSAGIAVRAGSELASQLLASADAALYHAKQTGRDRIVESGRYAVVASG